MLDKEVTVLCYPAGSYNHRVAKLAGQFGYKAAVTTKNRLSHYPLQDTDLYKIPRLSLGGENKYEIYEINVEIGRLSLKK